MTDSEKRARGTWTCKVCGREFALIEEELYTARDDKATGFATIAQGKEPGLYDAIDCPHCGCQNILQKRLRYAEVEEVCVDEVEDESDE